MRPHEKRKYKKRNRWEEPDEECLFNLWRKFISKGTGKQRPPYKTLAKQMGRRGFTFTDDEIRMKINNLITKYRREEKSRGSEWIHFQEIGEILKLRESVELKPQIISKGDPLETDECSTVDDCSQISTESERQNEKSESSNLTHHDFVPEKIVTIIKSENIFYDEEDHKSEVFITRPNSPLEVAKEEITCQEMNPAKLYSVFDQIKTSTENSLAEFKRATDLFEESAKVNRERNDLMKQYLNNSLDIQIEMLTLIRAMNNRFT